MAVRLQYNSRRMRAAAIIALLVAIVLGIAAIGNFIDDSVKRQRALNNMLSLRVDSPLRESYLAEIDKHESEERIDGILGLIAVTFLIGSLVMFSQVNKQKPDFTSHVR